MMYNLSNAMKNEIVKQLDEMCADSTNIEVTKYELFKNARHTVNDVVNYHDVRNEVANLVRQYCIEHDYTILAKWNGKYNTFVITTEPITVETEKKSRCRFLIPAEIVRNAGLKPGDKVKFQLFEDTLNNKDRYVYSYVYDNTKYGIPTINSSLSLVAYRTYTVDKDNAIRITDYFLEPDEINIESGAGYIVIK